jgi:hypothetical protein
MRTRDLAVSSQPRCRWCCPTRRLLLEPAASRPEPRRARASPFPRPSPSPAAIQGDQPAVFATAGVQLPARWQPGPLGASTYKAGDVIYLNCTPRDTEQRPRTTGRSKLGIFSSDLVVGNPVRRLLHRHGLVGPTSIAGTPEKPSGTIQGVLHGAGPPALCEPQHVLEVGGGPDPGEAEPSPFFLTEDGLVLPS